MSWCATRHWVSTPGTGPGKHLGRLRTGFVTTSKTSKQGARMYIKTIDVAGFLWKGDTLCLECTGAMFRKRWSTSKAAHWPIDDDDTTHDLIGQYARAHGRSEERRVGKACKGRRSQKTDKKKKKKNTK